jgi:hypothetical protein
MSIAETDRRALLREYNGMRTACQELTKKLERLEAHEGDDGCAEDVDAQCKLVDEIAAKRRRCTELHKQIYPKG